MRKQRTERKKIVKKSPSNIRTQTHQHTNQQNNNRKIKADAKKKLTGKKNKPH